MFYQGQIKNHVLRTELYGKVESEALIADVLEALPVIPNIYSEPYFFHHWRETIFWTRGRAITVLRKYEDEDSKKFI